MSLVSSFKKVVFQNYCNFKGRAGRPEYWYFQLAQAILGAIAIGIGSAVGDSHYMLMSLVSVALLLPNLGVTVRRLHDVGKGGGWIFITLVPVIGGLWLLYLLVCGSNDGSNRFGEEPQD
ncbi:MAG: DUF805 domain-containing protein [Prevotellaceae bacterium]|nr:DUF805 domain-containing protein [Prevotellaceae bacterium]